MEYIDTGYFLKKGQVLQGQVKPGNTPYFYIFGSPGSPKPTFGSFRK